MRGRIGALVPHRSSFFRVVDQFCDSESIVRPLTAGLCPTDVRSLGETPSSCSHARSLFDNQSGGDSQSQDSCAASKSLIRHHELLPVRSNRSSVSCQCTFAQSFGASIDTSSSWIRRFASVSAKRTELRCWSCEHEGTTRNGLFCPSCKAIQPLDPTVDYFQIFSVDQSFKVDLKVLEQSYKSLQKKLHPDLAGSKSQTEREYSADQSAHVIQAYFILVRPLSRARYLLGLHGIKVEEEGTIDDPELLMEIMEIRESISEISAAEALKSAEAENNDRLLNCEKELESCFGDHDLKRAVSWTQRLAYYMKVGEEILRKL